MAPMTGTTTEVRVKPTNDSIKKISSVDNIRNSISHVFQEAQLSLSGHRKLVVVMKNIFNRAIELNFEEHFAMYFTKLINKILPLKKGEQVADRIAKFCSSFVATISKDELARREEDQDEEEETYVGSFIKYLIHHLLRGIEAKDKNVRYRVVQILAYLVYYIGEIDNHTFEALYTSLNKRLHDKEHTVRIQAVVAFSRFQSFNFDFDESENPFTIPISKDKIMQNIITTIQEDDSAEVRRAALLNLNKNQVSVPYLIDRARDTNSINRRLVFSRISRELGDFKNIDFKYREHLLKWGLNDRDESVRKSAIKMFTHYWYEAANEDILELIDILRVTESKVAKLAMSAFFKGRQDKLETIKIDESYWKALTVEKAFLMRTFYDHCNENNLYDLIEVNFPESIDLAETLAKYLQLRSRFLLDNNDIIKKAEAHNERLEFIKSQLFTTENTLIKIKYEVDIYKRNLREEENSIADYEELLGLIEQRLPRLAATSRRRNSKQLKKLPKRKSTRLTIIPSTSSEESSDEDESDEENQLNYVNDTLGDIVTEGNEQVIQQLLEFTPAELELKHAEIKETIKSIKSEISELEEAILNSELKFKQGTERYHNLSKEKEDEIARFKVHDDEYLPFADELKDLEFIIEQLLYVSREFDFSDEIGRRKMLQTTRKSLTEDKLSSALISIGLQVLRKISINEKDFITMATEIITDIRDSYESEDETFHSAISGFDEDEEEEEEDDEEEDDEEENNGEGEKSNEKDEAVDEENNGDVEDDVNTSTRKIAKRKAKKRKIEPKLPPDEIVIRCLRITQNVLELIEEPLENHISLGSIYSGLVNYAIKFGEKYTLHLQGLKCLGLFSLIDKSTAQDAVSTFYTVMRVSGEEVRIIGMKAIIDILSTYGTSIMEPRILYQYGKLFYKSLNSFDMPKLQSVVAEGLCKLFLADVFSDTIKSSNPEEEEFETEKQLFEALILSYFHPLTQENQELRQVLAFCIPVFALSHPKHQFRLASVSGDCVYRMLNESSDFRHYENQLSPVTVIQQLIYWCDPNNLVNMDQEAMRTQTSHVWQSVYFLQVIEQDTAKLVKKTIINNLNKFYISEYLDSRVLDGLVKAIAGTREKFEENSESPEFTFDKNTLRNFEAFEATVKEQYEKSVEREKKEEANNSRNFSRASSVLSELDDSKATVASNKDDHEKPDNDDQEDGEKNQTSKSEVSENIVEGDEDVAMNEDSADEDGKEEEKSPNQMQIDQDLQDIDQMLDAEDEVDYDISLAN